MNSPDVRAEIRAAREQARAEALEVASAAVESIVASDIIRHARGKPEAVDLFQRLAAMKIRELMTPHPQFLASPTKE